MIAITLRSSASWTIRSTAYRSWTGQRIKITSRDGVVRAGVDGEALEFPSPLEISIAPATLRVRVPKDRPGPKVGWARVDRRIVARLWAILLGRGDPERT